MPQSKLQEEALRINARYLSEVVEAFDLCPWARNVQDGKGLKRLVFLQSEDSPGLRQQVAEAVETIARASEIDIGLFLFPRLTVSTGDFRRLVSDLEARHASAHDRDAIPLAMANFHPQAEANLESADRLVPFIRRSPDPTIQLVRRSTMASVRATENEGSSFVESLEAFLPLLGTKPKQSVSDNIARNNLRTVKKVGVEAIETILNDIRRDREKSYAAADREELRDGGEC